MEKYMIIDGERVPFTDEKNILAVIRKAGIILPTFCYYSDLSIYGACRMCVVEDNRGGIVASCSTPPKNGMEIRTNTPQLYYHRKRILELLLAAHCRDCTTCEKNGKCKLQELANRFAIPSVRFENTNPIRPIDTSSKAIVRNPNKCILCGDCVRVCSEIQHVGAIDFAHRGSDMEISTAFGRDIADTNCVNCGQCAAVCPTGAITIKNDTHDVWQAIHSEDKRVVVQIAPAVRVAIGEAYGYEPGENTIGKLIASLRMLGVDAIFDTSVGADLTIMEESEELVESLEEEGRKFPLFTSCCPGWIRFVETKYPYLMPYVDYVLTSEEVIGMLKEIGIRFDRLEPEAFDMPFSIYSGAGVIFGATGGVTEAAIRRVVADKSPKALKEIEFIGVRGMEGLKECTLDLDGRKVRIGIVSGLGNADRLIQKIESGEEHFDFVEVMACAGGCVAGAGQPFARSTEKRMRAEGLYKNDKALQIKRSEENPLVDTLYSDLLKNREHELLHVHYLPKNQVSQ